MNGADALVYDLERIPQRLVIPPFVTNRQAIGSKNCEITASIAQRHEVALYALQINLSLRAGYLGCGDLRAEVPDPERKTLSGKRNGQTSN